MTGTPAERLRGTGALYAFGRQEHELRKARLRAAIRDAVAAGMSEVEIARLAGVSRPTVRAWLGKGRR